MAVACLDSFIPEQFLRKYYSFSMFCGVFCNIWFDIPITVFLSFLSLGWGSCHVEKDPCVRLNPRQFD